MNMLNKVQGKYIYLLNHLSFYSGDLVKAFPAAFFRIMQNIIISELYLAVCCSASEHIPSNYNLVFVDEHFLSFLSLN